VRVLETTEMKSQSDEHASWSDAMPHAAATTYTDSYHGGWLW